MNKIYRFYIDDSKYTRVTFTTCVVIFMILFLICLRMSFESFEFRWLSVFVGITIICVLLMLNYRIKSYIEIGDEGIVIYKPKKRYSLKFNQYIIHYDEIRWCFFNKIRNIYFGKRSVRSRGMGAKIKSRYLFLIEKITGEYIFIARSDFNEKWTRGGFFGNSNLGEFKKLNDLLTQRGVKPYDQNKHSRELEEILKRNKLSIRMGYFYRKKYLIK